MPTGSAAGHVKTIGNWSPGQIYRHLAIAFNGSIDGLPNAFPWYMRLDWPGSSRRSSWRPDATWDQAAGRLREGRAAPETSTEQGLAELRAAVARSNESQIAPGTLSSAR